MLISTHGSVKIFESKIIIYIALKKDKEGIELA